MTSLKPQSCLASIANVFKKQLHVLPDGSVCDLIWLQRVYCFTSDIAVCVHMLKQHIVGFWITPASVNIKLIYDFLFKLFFFYGCMFLFLIFFYFLFLQDLDVKAGGGCVMTIGEMLRSFLTKLEWFSTLFPRIPVPVQKHIDQQMKAKPRKVKKDSAEVTEEADRHVERRRSRFLLFSLYSPLQD